jgi:hypothetical protein
MNEREIFNEWVNQIGRNQCAQCDQISEEFQEPQYCEICEGRWVKGFDDEED